MRERKPACLDREMEQLTTEQLDELLQNELRKEAPDENVVLPILKVLRHRETDHPAEVSNGVANAWEQYQTHIAIPDTKKPAGKRVWLTKGVAAAVVICLLVLAFPFAVDADGTLDVLYRVTESIVEFFRPGGGKTDSLGEYTFETDNPGLQQVYDAAVEIGATAPVVPMWLPEGYVLEGLDVIANPVSKKVHAQFDNNENSIIIQITLSEDITSTQYEQGDGGEIYDTSNIKHIIFDNRDHLSAMWFNENLEGLINITESKDTLYRIIDSIYRRK